MTPQRMTATRGVTVIDDTNAKTSLNFVGFKPTADTAISVITGENVNTGQTGIDFKTKYNWDGTLKSSDLPYVVAEGEKITAITLSSGSIQCF